MSSRKRIMSTFMKILLTCNLLINLDTLFKIVLFTYLRQWYRTSYMQDTTYLCWDATSFCQHATYLCKHASKLCQNARYVCSNARTWYDLMTSPFDITLICSKAVFWDGTSFTGKLTNISCTLTWTTHMLT